MNKKILIGIGIVSLTLVLLSTINGFHKPTDNQENIPITKDKSISVNNEFAEIIIVTFAPKKFTGLERGYEDKASNITEQDLESVPKIKQVLEYALMASKMQLNDTDTFVKDDPPSKYIIYQSGPFTFDAESYLTSNELNQYHLWTDKNLIAYPVLTLPDYHFLKYKDEVFTMYFVSTSQPKPNQSISYDTSNVTKGSPKIKVNTDSLSYHPGDTITISGNATLTDPTLLIQIFYQGNLVDMVTVTLQEDGRFSHKVIVSGPLWESFGEYSLVVTDSKGHTSTTIFDLIPTTSSEPKS